MKDGGPAFPRLSNLTNNDGPRTMRFVAASVGGMTLRDYFAAQAMAGTMANPVYADAIRSAGAESPLARSAYMMADAMLAEREKERS